MGRADFKVEMMSWAQAESLSRQLARKIQKSGWKPDIIVGIARGGLIPAVLVSDELLIKAVAALKIEHYWIAAGRPSRARVAFPLGAPVRGKKVLVVDDFTDTGKSLGEAVAHIKKLKPKEIRTAVLQHKITSKFLPDYFVQKIVKWRWIASPWAAHENLVDFVGRVRKRGMSAARIAAQLRKRFGIRASVAEIRAVLS